MTKQTNKIKYASYRVAGAPRKVSMNIRCTAEMRARYGDKIKDLFQYLENCTARNEELCMSEIDGIFNFVA